ncbi:extended synaptotagmin-3 [Spea bombifrons]|uniref:extended synaptotagmin-3 n=1 Tax=Spea bombifrons TaxID=233779 RepID=UPI00234AEA2E|nr:extended synaptotagmin-3 [Spea bombifrons]
MKQQEQSPGPGGDPLALLVPVRRVLWLLVPLLPVYVCGRLGLGPLWLGLGSLLWVLWLRNKRSKAARLTAAWELLDDESLGVTRGLNPQQLPSWVNFPDVERVEWVNKVLGQAWPYFGAYVERMLTEKVEPLIRASNVHLKAFTFTKISFGQKFPRVNGVKAYAKNVDKREVILDVQICYTGDCEINVEVKKLCKAGVKGVQLHGTLRVILAPLLPEAPFFGAVTMFFIQKPHLEINWTGITNVLEIPGVSDMSDSMIIDIISSHLVLPNRLTVPLKGHVNIAQLRYPVPQGVLRVHLIEAENLIPKDNYLRGVIRGKSDPYVVLRVGNQMFKSRTIKENLNPRWGDTYEFVVHEVPGQDLEVDLYDEDPDKDDFLGSLVVGLEGVMKDRVVQEWFPLSDVASGKVHFKLEWFSLLAAQEKLREAEKGLTTAMLIVYLDSACNLPRNHFEFSNNEYARKQKYASYPKVEKEPSAYVVLSVGKKFTKSKTCAPSKDPVWEQGFAFFIQDPHMQHLHAEVKDDERQCVLGLLDFPLHRLLGCEDLTAEQRFPLSNSGADSGVRMKLVLRVLHVEEPDPEAVYSGINSMKHGPVSIRRAQEAKPRGKQHKPSEGQQQSSQGHAVPPPKLLRKDSAANSAQRPNHAGHEQSTAAPRNPTGSAPRNPNLRTLQRIAPSLISLNSVASSCFDPYEGHGATDVVSGEIQISVQYVSSRRCLSVTVGCCRNLTRCSSTGADPYVRIYLLPDRRWPSRKKTTVKRKTLNPEYNEKFEFLAFLEDVKKRMLDVAVKNNRSFGSHERKELGKVLVDLSTADLVEGFTEWFELTPSGHPGS